MNTWAHRALALILVSSPLLLVPAPAEAAAAGTIQLVQPGQPVLKGDRITLKGQFQNADQRAFVIQKAKPGSNSWTTIKSTRGTTTHRGVYAARYTPTQTLKYRAVLPATTTRPKQVSTALKVPVTTGWRAVSEGLGHTCGIWSDRTLWCWGWNYYGQLGDPATSGTGNAHPAPTQVLINGNSRKWLSVATGNSHTCAIRVDHTLWCWGLNQYGQLGNATGNGTTTAYPAPKKVVASGTDQAWKSVATGGSHTCGIRADDTLWCWGRNYYGQLGNATNNTTDNANPTPTKVNNLAWTSVSGGEFHTCGIRGNSTLWCWGGNDSGQLGNANQAGTYNPNPTPTKVNDKSWRFVSGRVWHTCAIRADRTLWCWGSNYRGELGNATNNGSSTPNPSPTKVVASGSDQTWDGVSTGNTHTCGIRTDRTMWCWGLNLYGELGNATNSNTTNPNPAPTKVNNHAWGVVAADNYQSCAIRTNHSLWCWGDNSDGALGHATNAGTTNPNPTPTRVPDPA